MIDIARDGRPLPVLKRAPLLFHTILLTATYYNYAESSQHLDRYNSLVTVVNTVVAPQILCPQTSQFNADFVRALILLIVYKPVQYEALHLSGTCDVVEAEVASKLNKTTNLLLASLISRSAHAVGLHMIPNAFFDCFSPTGTVSISPQLLSDLRLWFFICASDNHGSIQNGRPGSADCTDALKVTRLFASIKSQPFDVRLAALTELYALPARAMPSRSNGKLYTLDINRFNTEYVLWEDHWTPLLKEATLAGDPLAYTVLFPHGNYLRLVINSSVLGRWVSDLKGSDASDDWERPELSDQDWECLQIACDSAEKIIFSLSMESRSTSHRIREVAWPPKQGNKRPPLHLDLEVVENTRMALDTILCVVRSFF
jgi:hypothetical protein